MIQKRQLSYLIFFKREKSYGNIVKRIGFLMKKSRITVVVMRDSCSYIISYQEIIGNYSLNGVRVP